MKKKQTKQVNLIISQKDKYYNLTIIIDDMKVAVQPKFLNNKQKALLSHKIARLVGDEEPKKESGFYSAGSLDGETYIDDEGNEQVLRYVDKRSNKK